MTQTPQSPQSSQVIASALPNPHPNLMTRGLWLGLLAVVMFALTLPMTKLAIGGHNAPMLSPWFVTFGRAAVAGLCSAAYLLWCRARWPQGRQWVTLLHIALGNGIGFALLQSLGLMYVPSSHAAVFNGLLPLSTAVVAAILFRQRAPNAFWGWAVVGALLVVAFAVLRAYQKDGALTLHWADVLIFSAVLCAGYGYAHGAKLARELPAEQGLCWALVLLLPVTFPAAWMSAPSHALPASAWIGFAYVSVCSMWLGMMIWFYALHIGGAVRVSQIQIVQPFLAIVFSAPILGERLDVLTLIFAAAVVFAAYQGKKVPLSA